MHFFFHPKAYVNEENHSFPPDFLPVTDLFGSDTRYVTEAVLLFVFASFINNTVM